MTLELPECGSDSGSGSGSGSESESSNKVIEEAVKVLLQGLGEDHEREGIKKTPLRVAKAFRDGTRGMLVVFSHFDWFLFYLFIKFGAFWGNRMWVPLKISSFLAFSVLYKSLLDPMSLFPCCVLVG